MKRPIVIVAMIYAAGLCAGQWLDAPRLWIALAVLLIGLTQLVQFARKRSASDFLLLAAVFLFGVHQQRGVEREDALARLRLAVIDTPAAVQLEGRLVALDRSYESRDTFRLRDCRIRHAGRTIEFPTEIQLVCTDAALNKARTQPPESGDRIVAQGRLVTPPDLSNPDVFNYRAYLESRGIGASLFVREADALQIMSPARGRSAKEWAVRVGERLRRSIEAALDEGLDPQAAALVRSVFLGQAERLDSDAKRNFTRCGLAHIFSVSGLHVAMLLWVLNAFVRVFGFRPVVRNTILIAALAVFCLIVGLRPAAVRAAIMLAAVLAPVFLGYRIDSLTSLAAAALAILAVDPRALGQASFQMSFVCMFSIIVMMPMLSAWLQFDEEAGSTRRRQFARLGNRHAIPCMLLAVAAQIGMLPFLVHYFHMVPLVGFLANLPAAFLVWLILTITLAYLGAAAALPMLAPALGGALEASSHALLWLLDAWSNLPAVSLTVPGWPVFVSVAFYLSLYGWVAMPATPSPFFEAKQRARMIIGLATIVALVVWTPTLMAWGRSDLRATFLDVGQGDSCVIELPGGAVVVIDGGPAGSKAGEFIVAPFLEARGIDRLDAVIATHADADHIGGLPSVLRRFDARWLIEGPGTGDTRSYQELGQAAMMQGVMRERVRAGDRLDGPLGARITFLHPPRGVRYSESNDESLVLQIDWGDFEILIAGDIEQKAERDLLASKADLRADVLKVAHHGSRTATSPGFLERVRPRLAVISCGRDNSYGHPAGGVLENLEQAGALIARTDQHGAVQVEYRRGRLLWHTEKPYEE